MFQGRIEQLLTTRPAHLSAPSSGPDTEAVDCVKETLFCLTSRPGKFDELMPQLTKTLNDCISNEKTLLEMIELILEQVSSTLMKGSNDVYSIEFYVNF